MTTTYGDHGPLYGAWGATYGPRTYGSLTPTRVVNICWSAGVQEYEGSDDFLRADAPSSLGTALSGQAWTTGTGTAGITFHHAYFSALSGGQGLAYVRAIANGDTQVTLSTIATGAGLAFRVQDPDNYWRVVAGSGVWNIYRVVDGSATLVDNPTGTTANGTVLKVRAEGSALRIYVNGFAIGTTITDSTFSSVENVGLYSEATSARFADFSASLIWTDVSAYVEDGWHWSRGRTHEFDRMEAGELTLTLSNIDRRFEPEYADSPYYPFVLPMRRVRIQATWAGVTYDRFYGFIERWPLSWSDRLTDAKVTVTAVDSLAFLSYRITADYSATIQSYEPYAYFRMSGDSDAINDISANNFGTLNFIGSASAAEVTPGLLPGFAGDDGAINRGASGGTLQFTVPSGAEITGTTDFTICLLMDENVSGDDNVVGTVNVGLWIESTGDVLKGRTANVAGSIIDGVTPAAGVGVGAVWAAFVRRGLVLELWLNGVLDATKTLGAKDSIPAGAWSIGDTATLDKTYDEIAWFDYALSPGQLLNLANIAGYGPGGVVSTLTAGQTTGERVEVIADALGFGPLVRTIDPGTTTVAADDLSAGDPRTLLEGVRQTEYGGGWLFIDGAGHLVFRDNHYTREQASQDTWSDQPGSLHYAELEEPSLDVDRIANLVTVAVPDSAPIVVGDFDSQQSYQQRPLSVDTVHEEMTNARIEAQWLMRLTQEPQLRFDAMTVDGATQGGIWDHVLNRELADRITVEVQPPGGGDLLTREVLIEKISETVTPDSWTLDFQLAPEPMGQPTPRGWLLGTSVLGVNTFLVPV